MNRKAPLILAIFLALILICFLIFTSKTKQSLQKTLSPSTAPSPATSKKTEDEALKNALNLYGQKKSEGLDFSNGPCLGPITQDWVLDIAHDPRIPQDDKPENQCAEYQNGQAHHFIELNPDGKLIKIN